MKSPDRFMARGLAEAIRDEKGAQGRHPEVPSRSGGLEGWPRCRGPSFEARKSAHLRMTAENVAVAPVSATAAAAATGAEAAARAMRRHCGLRPSSRPDPRQFPHRS